MFRFFIAFRYIQGKTGQLLSVNARLSFIGVFTGMVLLVMVLSVFNGFQHQVRKSIMGFDPHLKVGIYGEEQIIHNFPSLIKKIQNALGDSIASIEPMVQSPAILKVRSIIEPVVLRSRSFIKNKDGSYTPPSDLYLLDMKGKTIPRGNYCLIGKEMAVLYNLHIGDSFDLIVPRGQFSLRVGLTPSKQRFRIAGFFKTGHYNYDSSVVLVDHTRAQKLFKISSADTQNISVVLKDPKQLRGERFKLTSALTPLPIPFKVRTIEDDQRNFFAALQLEKTIMTTIVFLLVIAAMLFILVSIFSAVRSRKKDIGVLKAMGASSSDILIIFLLNGFTMGMAGALLGIMTGIFLALNLESIILFIEFIINHGGELITLWQDPNALWIPVQLIPRDVYYFDHLPVNIDVKFLHTMGTLAVFMAGISSAIPAWYASRMEAMDILRRADS